MKIRFTDGKLKNRMFDVIEINKNSTVARVWNENKPCTIDLRDKSYQLLGFEE